MCCGDRADRDQYSSLLAAASRGCIFRAIPAPACYEIRKARPAANHAMEVAASLVLVGQRPSRHVWVWHVSSTGLASSSFFLIRGATLLALPVFLVKCFWRLDQLLAPICLSEQHIPTWFSVTNIPLFVSLSEAMTKMAKT